MRPVLGIDHYRRPELFDTERRAIFRRLWLLGAIRPMVANHHDFRTVTLAGVPLVLQNHHGQVRAFANICRHRGAAIQTQEFGNRPLVCPYHHWAYDGQGRLAFTHRDPEVFGFTSEEAASLRLREYRTETVGGLVFVNLHEHPLPIEEQFGAATLAQLAKATSHMDSVFAHTRYEARFNWKIGMENIVDPLHVQCLHQQSFPTMFQVSVPRATPPRPDAALRDVPLPEATLRGDTPIAPGQPPHEWQTLVEQLDSRGSYQQFVIFPNVNLMIVDGTSFAVQVYNPLAVDRTEMQMSVVLTRETPASAGEFAYKPVVLWEHLHSDMTVLNEDLAVLEAMQANFDAAGDEFAHGAYESGVLAFQAACLSQLRRAARADGDGVGDAP